MIDTHIHLWDLDHLTYSFLRKTDPMEEAVLGNYDAIKRTYLIEHYLEDIKGCGVTKAVHVQAALGHPRPVEETAWLQGIADHYGYPHAVIGHCDLCGSNVAETLDGHIGFENFRGIRMLGTQGLLEDEQFRQGFAALADRGLLYELEATLEDMPAAYRLARKFPETSIVLTHTGMPMQRTSEYYRRWRDAMRSLAAAENVICKISGLGMTDHGWTTASIRPWIECAIETFGANRCMFGTNWPVDSLYSSYSAVVNAYRNIIGPLGNDEQHALLCGTATRIYRL